LWDPYPHVDWQSWFESHNSAQQARS
jgi:hypothetical protein